MPVTPHVRLCQKSKKRRVGEEILFWRDPALPMIEGRCTRSTSNGYREHTHPTLSVGIVDEGPSKVRLGSMRCIMRQGDVIVIAPGLVHACNPSKFGSWSYRMFYIDPVWARASLSTLAGTSRFPQAVLRQAKARAWVNEIEDALLMKGPAAVRIRKLVRSLDGIFRLCRRAPQTHNSPNDDVEFQRAKAYLDSHLFDRVPVSRLASEAGMSAYQFIRRFREATGLTPHAYQIDRRINHSRELLKSGSSATEVAYVAGFSDQSHFIRAFKTRVAATPAAFSARKLQARRS